MTDLQTRFNYWARKMSHRIVPDEIVEKYKWFPGVNKDHVIVQIKPAFKAQPDCKDVTKFASILATICIPWSDSDNPLPAISDVASSLTLQNVLSGSDKLPIKYVPFVYSFTWGDNKRKTSYISYIFVTSDARLTSKSMSDLEVIASKV